MKKKFLPAVVILTIATMTNAARSQVASGSTFTLEKAVISNGGGGSSGTLFSLEGTAGQSSAGPASGTLYSLEPGFWYTSLAPTAAAVSVSGRVFSPSGSGLPHAVVLLTDESGTTRSALTTGLGYYVIDGLTAGQTIIIEVRSKVFEFEPRALTLYENLADVDFTPTPANLDGIQK